MSKINLQKIQEVVSKKQVVSESWKDLLKTRFDISFVLIEEISEMLENSYEAHRYNEAETANGGEVSLPPYIDLKGIVNRLMDVRDFMIESLPTEHDKTIFEGTNKEIYKAGKIKLDDGKTTTLSKLDADYLNAFAGSDVKWYRLLTKSEKDFKEVVALSKS